MTTYSTGPEPLPSGAFSDTSETSGGNNTFLAKPSESRPGQLGLLFPADTGVESIRVIGPDGKVIFDSIKRTTGQDTAENPARSQGLSNGGRPTFFIPPVPPGSRVIGTRGGQEVYSQTILNPSARQENGTLTGGGGSQFGTRTDEFGNVGVIPNSLNPFTSLGFDRLSAPNIPRVEAPSINPLIDTALTGGFNQAAFSDIIQNSLQSIPDITELLNAINIGSSGQVFNAQRQQVGAANQVNQEALTQRVDEQLPGFRDATQEDFGVARTLASGQLPDFIDERVLVGSSRNAAADASTFGGFGAGSVFGRNVSDRLDARTRLGLVQQGQNLTDQIANRAFSTFVDRPAKVSPIVQNPVNATGMFSDFTNTQVPLSTIAPNASLQSQTQQGQFQSQLDTNRVNNLAQFGFDANRYNSGQALAINQAVMQQDLMNNAMQFNALQSFLNATNQSRLNQDQLSELNDARDTQQTNQLINTGLSLGTEFLTSETGQKLVSDGFSAVGDYLGGLFE